MDSSIQPVMPVGGDGFGGFGGGGFWIFALLILFGMMGGGFGFGGFGGRGPAPDVATKDFVLGAIDNQSTQAALGQIALSSADNNYQTAQLIQGQTRDLMQQTYADQINVIQGFNQLQSQIAGLGARMDSCCCEIKTQLLQDKYDETARELAKAQNEAVNAAQSQYLLGVMGKWVANAPAVI